MEKAGDREVKTVLYAYRVVMTGIHVLKTGTVDANIISLNKTFGMSAIPELITAKSEEHRELPEKELQAHLEEIHRLAAELDESFERSELPERAPRARDLDEFVVSIRVQASKPNDL